MGRPGCGKSSVAEFLSGALGWERVSSDRTRKRLAGLSPEQPVPEAQKTEVYGESMSGKTYDSLIGRAVDRACRGHSTILDATFGRRAYRDRLRSELEAGGVRRFFIELDAPEDVLKRRMAERDDRPGRAVFGSDARVEDFEKINAAYEGPDALEDARHRRIRSTRSAAETAEEVLKHLAASRQPTRSVS